MDMHTRIWEKRDQLVGVDKALSGILFMRRAVFDHTVLPFLFSVSRRSSSCSCGQYRLPGGPFHLLDHARFYLSL